MTTPIGEGAQGGAEGTQSGAGTSIEPTGTATGTSETGTQSGAASTSPESDALNQQLEQQRLRTQAADKRAAEFEQQLRQLRDKDLPEAEKLKRDFEESQAQVTKLQGVNQELALKVAFLSDNTYSWHNPDRALKLVDLSQVTIEEDGSVSGLKEALKALATSDDYLVKKEATEKQVETKPASTAAGNNGGAGGSAPSRAKLTSRFPTMGTRVRRS